MSAHRPLQILNSQEDSSKNHVYEDGSEFRLVTRGDSSTIYLSSHTGCSLGCRMCWLTQQKQTQMKSLVWTDIVSRAQPLYDETTTDFVNFAFMSRGDPLASPCVDGVLVQDLTELGLQARANRSPARHTKVTLSTIFPKKQVGDDIANFLFHRFAGAPPPIIYWSLYSLIDEVREKWIPNAQSPEIVAKGLAEWQKHTFTEIVVHFPLIKNVNDGYISSWDMHRLLKQFNLRYRVNLIHYNPPPGGEFGEEADVQTYADRVEEWRGFIGEENAKIQPRVGRDVYASCGMFVAPTA